MASPTGSNNTVLIKKRFPKDQNNNKSDSDEKQQEKPSPILNPTENAIAPLAFLSTTPPTNGAVVGPTSGTRISSNASATLGGIPRNVNVASSLLQKRSYDVFSGGNHILQPGSNVQLLNVPHPVNFPWNGEYLVRSENGIHSPKSLVGYMRSQPSHNKKSTYESADVQPLKEVARDKGKKQVASLGKEAAAEPSPTRRNDVNIHDLKLVDNRTKYRVPDLNFPPPEDD